MTRYNYLVLPAEQVKTIFAAAAMGPGLPDSYLSEDEVSKALAIAIDSGFRWVRTDGDSAIFEQKKGEV
jgi:hypothetical protein